MTENGNQLTPKQARAITALLQSRNVAEAAQIAGVGERTLFRWLALPDFRAALVAAEGDAIDQATRRLINLQNQAIDTLGEVLTDPDVGAWARLKAAQSVLDYLLKLRELRNVEQRLAELENRVYEQ